MNWKRIAITVVALTVLMAVLETIINQLLLSEIYGSLSDLWRPAPDLGAKAYIFIVIYVATAASITGIFTAFELKHTTWATGAVVGAWFGVLARFFYGYTNYIVLPIPHLLAFLWFALGAIECVVLGIVAQRMLAGRSTSQ